MTHCHGATSEAKIAPLARNHRRRKMRQLRLSPRDLDAPARGYLQLYVRTAAKIDILDAYFAENEFVRADGRVTPAATLYPTLAARPEQARGACRGNRRARPV